MSFLMPTRDATKINNPSEDVRHGTVVDPGKYKDPKNQGRVKVRVPEIHGDHGSGIPDEDLPWSMLERQTHHGNLAEQGHFGLPQKDSMVKIRHHGSDKYSPIAGAAPYSTPGKIKEWSPPESQQGQSQQGSQDSSKDFNQKDHYGVKDPLGNIIHHDMKKKILTIDLSKHNNISITLPQTSLKIVKTKNDETKGTYEDEGSSGGSSQSVGLFGSSQNSGTETPGNFTISIDGDHSHSVGGALSQLIQKSVSLSHNSDYTHSVGGAMSRTVSGDISVKGSGGRSDTYSKAWSSKAKETAWAWLTSLSTITNTA